MTSGENQELKIKKSKYILFLRFIIEFSRIIIIIITIIIIIVVVVVVVVIIYFLLNEQGYVQYLLCIV